MNFQTTEIANQSNICLDILTPMIGTSRVLSMSAFIDPLFCLRKVILFEPMIELCFFASFLSTPVLFYWGMQHMITTGEIAKSTHPMINLILVLNKRFGSFLRGKFQRFQTASDKVFRIFHNRQNKLKEVVRALIMWIDYIDSHENHESISIHVIAAKMELVKDDIKSACGDTSIDFSLFRLSLFTNIVMALGITKSGQHQHEFFIPIINTAASNHLLNPRMNENRDYSHTGGQIDDDSPIGKKRKCDDFVDKVFVGENIVGENALKTNHWTLVENRMQTISSEMRWKKYTRSLVEVCLCKSVNGRSLRKKDVFIKNQYIFRLNSDGKPQVQKFGPQHKWENVFSPMH